MWVKKHGLYSLPDISFNRSQVLSLQTQQSASLPLDLTLILSSAGFPIRTAKFSKYLHCTAMFVEPHLPSTRLQYCNVYATLVLIIYTHSNREGALKFVYVFSQHCNFEKTCLPRTGAKKIKLKTRLDTTHTNSTR